MSDERAWPGGSEPGLPAGGLPAHGEAVPAPQRDEPAAAVTGGDASRRDVAGPDTPRPDTTGPDTTDHDASDSAVDGADGGDVPAAGSSGRRRGSGAGAVIGILLALLGFALAIQVKSNTPDQTLAGARQEDLLRLLSELDNSEKRLQQDIAELQQTRDDLVSSAADRRAALDEAKQRADELGILAGTLPATGPGITVTFDADTDRIAASMLLDAVQELRAAGAEAMQLDAGGGSVRIVTSSNFTDAPTGAIWVDGLLLTGPYTLTIIGDPQSLIGAVTFLNGVQSSITNAGGTVTYSDPGVVSITTLRSAPDLRFAQPVS